MLRAIEVARRSVAEDRPDPPPRVGAVVVKDGRLLAGAHRGLTGDGDHAEYGALRACAPGDLEGATVFTTLEPCTARSPGKTPCAQLLVQRGIAVVYIGSYDPNPEINRVGWRTLVDEGVTVRDFDGDLRQEIEAINKDFIDQFRQARGDTGRATFDYEQNGGTFEVSTSLGLFMTRWGKAGHDSIHAYDAGAGHPALAKHASQFEQIDDPAGYDFSRHFVTPSKGDIVVFPGPGGYVLVMVEAVSSGQNFGAAHTSLTINWQARRPGRASAVMPGD